MTNLINPEQFTSLFFKVRVSPIARVNLSNN